MTATSLHSVQGRKLERFFAELGAKAEHLMNADGSAQRNLTRNAGRDLAPAWWPDGRRIAFGSVRNGKPRVYVLNSDGSGRRRLTQHGERPLWSPDRRSIAFRSRRDGNFEVYVMNADGSGQRNLTRSPATDEQFAWAPGWSK